MLPRASPALGRAYTELRLRHGGASRVPDVAFYRHGRLPREQRLIEPPGIAGEVVSPDQSIGELEDTCRWYVAQGSAAALLADPETRLLKLFTLQDERTAQGLEPLQVLPDLTLTADAVFQDVIGS